ncbi:MAG: DUF1592 domain-containing protein [Polyangiaceae bacterium]|nr:DUF1592 domain-containing protein [Polyangiaceae bacterium]
MAPRIRTLRTPRLALAPLLLAVATSATLACTDGVDELAGAGPDSVGTETVSPGGIVCNPADRPAEGRLKRLTTTQYRNTLRDLVAASTGDVTQVDATLGNAPSLSLVPVDVREKTTDDIHGSYRRLDQTLQESRVGAYYQVGVELGHALTTATLLPKVVGTCATDANTANDAACIDAFVRTFGARAYRRPLTDDEVTFYRNVYGSSTAQSAEAYADVIGVMVNAPQFLYLVEHGTTPLADEPNTFLLGPYELASRLSYQLWDSMPDEALFAAAADGSLLKDDVYAREVERMFASPRTKATLGEFFRDWTKADDLGTLDGRNADPTFRSFAGENLPTPTLREEMIQDAVGTADWVVWGMKGSLADLLTTPANVNRGAELARIYGQAPWNGVGEPPAFAVGSRPGLFTRAMFLSTGSATTRPIMKGVYLRKVILCDKLDLPPQAAFTAPDLRPDMTTREVVEQLTEGQGSSCAGCHAKQINPLGFATEGFDALGRARKEQRLFDEKGNPVGAKPVRTDTVPYIDMADATPSSGPQDLMAQLAKSPKTASCLARNYFRFTAGRWEEKGDGCSLQKLEGALRTGPIRDFLKASVLDPRFRQRVFTP